MNARVREGRVIRAGPLLVSGHGTEGDAPSEMGNPEGGTCLQGGKVEFPSGHLESDVPVKRASRSSPMDRQLLRCSGKDQVHQGVSSCYEHGRQDPLFHVSQFWLSCIDPIVKLKLLPTQGLLILSPFTWQKVQIWASGISVIYV